MKTYTQITTTLLITTLTLTLSAQIDVIDGGKVGIGTETPTYKLDVVGSINFTDSIYQNGEPLQSGMWEEGSGTASYDGNVGIGTSAPTQKLDVNGNINVTGEILQNGQPFSAGSIPTGVIVMWSGAMEDIPEGWSLCDGTNGTPNLLDRFIVGAGNTYGLGVSGGSPDAIVVEHTHSINDPGHSHQYSGYWYGGGTYPHMQGGTGQNFSKSTTSNATGITINSAGSTGVNANLPPYYALAYIMKL